MNTSGNETESAANVVSVTTSSSDTPNLKGPTIFVYIISTLTGLAAGGLVASACREKVTVYLNWPEIVGYIALRSGPLGGLVVAWFWTKIMTWHVRNHKSSGRLMLYGILWGVLAGWIATLILWGFECIFFAGIEGLSPPIEGMLIGCTVFFGTIGGLGAGLICGGVWAVWYQKQNSQNVC